MNRWMKTGLLSLFAMAAAHAAVNFPFPQNADYGNGITLSDKASAAAQLRTAFSYYYSTFYRDEGTYACVRADPGDNQCYSEGMGYGMLMMVYFSDATTSYQAEFDKLWAFYKAAEDKNGLMNWKIGDGNPATVWGEYAATDAEMDVAAALIMAAYQFGDNSYLSEAKTLLQNVRAYEFETNGLHKPGDNWNDKKNPSYVALAYYKLFAAVDTDGANFWNSTAYEANAALLETNSAEYSTGLFDNWCDATGKGLDSYYGYDAARTPWRLAQDYYWFGDTRAEAMLNKLGTWTNAQSASTVDGSIGRSGSMGADHNNTFVSTLMSSLVTSSDFQSQLDAYWNESVSTTNSESNQKYFQKSMEILNGLLVSGNMPNMAASSGTGSSPVPQKMAVKIPKAALQGRTLELHLDGASKVELVTLDGRAKTLWSGKASGSVRVSLEKFPAGVYLAKIRSSNATVLQKIVLE